MKRALLTALLLTLCIPLTFAQNGLTTKQFVYVTNQADDTISGYSLNTTTGHLTEISGSPFDPGKAVSGPDRSRPTPMAHICTSSTRNRFQEFQATVTTPMVSYKFLTSINRPARSRMSRPPISPVFAALTSLWTMPARISTC